MTSELRNKKEAWLHAVRLRTLPLALASILAGSFLAAYEGDFRWEVLLLAALTTTFLQILSNLANDYGDTIHGADSAERQGPVRAVQSGLISLVEMKQAMYLVGFLSLGSGLSLLYVSLQDWTLFLTFLLLGGIAIWAAVSYTSGKNPYGYAGLGDISVFLFFGLLGVTGTYFLHTGSFDGASLLIAAAVGFFSTSVLNINNIRDIESDQKAGKKSIPVRIGKRSAITYNWALIDLGNISLIAWAYLSENYISLIALAALPLMIVVGLGVQKAESSKATDPFLKKMALSTLLWVLLFGLGILF